MLTAKLPENLLFHEWSMPKHRLHHGIKRVVKCAFESRDLTLNGKLLVYIQLCCEQKYMQIIIRKLTRDKQQCYRKKIL